MACVVGPLSPRSNPFIIMAKKYEVVITAPIKSIDDEVRVNDNGYEYYVVRFKSIKKGKQITLGGALAVSAEVVDEFGIDAMIGCTIKRYVLISEDA